VNTDSTSKCGVCCRLSEQTDGWWTVHNYKTDPPTVSDLCPSCYRNKSLLALREIIMDELKAIKMDDTDPAVRMGMETMKMRCIAIVRDTIFND
jgi:hypothetical protein